MKRKKDNENNVVGCLIVLGIGATIGALIGLGLSFTALSPLIMGGITAAVPVALLACLIIFDEESSKRGFFLSVCFCAASAAIGVGLAAAATTIFPGAVFGMGSATLAGAAIGVIAPIAALCATVATVFAAKKVNEYIISPIIEHFSSKEQEI